MSNPEKIVFFFEISGRLISCEPLHKGNINDTYVISFEESGCLMRRYILQRINREVFKSPVAVMENIAAVTAHLRRRIKAEGGNPRRETLTVIPAKSGDNYYIDPIGEYWRIYEYIESTVSYSTVDDPLHFCSAGAVIGRFHGMLADFPAATLHETIPDFHNTPKRFQNFLEAVGKDSYNRLAEAEEEISLIMERERFAPVLTDMYRNGDIPLRVIHNDTKFNNILIDKKSGEGLCLVDLDTVMPGLLPYDFGDAIRSGANTAREEDGKIQEAGFDIKLFEAFCEGYLPVAQDFLSRGEIKSLAPAPRLMTFECAMRFLEDYLRGDRYFKISYPEHNLHRARVQLKLLRDMEEKAPATDAVLAGLLKDD